MEIFKIAAIGVLTAFTVVMLKDTKPEIAAIAGAAGGALILICVADYAARVFGAAEGLIAKTGIDPSLLSALIKIVGIGYVTEFAAGVCEDAGSRGIADKLTVAGRVVITALSLPILTAVLDTVSALLKIR